MKLSNDKTTLKGVINTTRGVAIVLMLWGHVIQYSSINQFDFFENPAFKFIYSFHMPLFMLISGYLFYQTCQRYDLEDILRRKTRSIFHPIVTCTIMNYFLSTVLHELIYSGTLTSALNGQWISDLKPLWFLWSVLAASYVVAFADKIRRHRVISVMIILFGYEIMRFFPNDYLNQFMYPYFVIGYFLSKYEHRLKQNVKNFIGGTSFIAWVIMLLNYRKEHYIYITKIGGSLYSTSEYLKIDMFRWLIGLFGSIGVIWIFSLLWLFFSRYHSESGAKYKMTMIIQERIANIGIISLQIYALSVSLLSFWLPQIAAGLYEQINWNNHMGLFYLNSIVITLLYLIILCGVVHVIYRIKLGEIIFGR